MTPEQVPSRRQFLEILGQAGAASMLAADPGALLTTEEPTITDPARQFERLQEFVWVRRGNATATAATTTSATRTPPTPNALPQCPPNEHNQRSYHDEL
jgi:hypothetical protein